MVDLVTGDKCLKVIRRYSRHVYIFCGRVYFSSVPSLPFLDYIIKTTQGPELN